MNQIVKIAFDASCGKIGVRLLFKPVVDSLCGPFFTLCGIFAAYLKAFAYLPAAVLRISPLFQLQGV